MAISDKHKAFCKALLKHSFNQTKAYQSVYKGTSADVARANASRLLINANIREHLEKLKEKDGIKDLVTIEEVVSGIKEVLEYSLKDKDDIKDGTALKALEMLGRYKAMFTDKTINENHDTTELSFQDVAERE